MLKSNKPTTKTADNDQAQPYGVLLLSKQQLISILKTAANNKDLT
jgi:hypothetical protein